MPRVILLFLFIALTSLPDQVRSEYIGSIEPIAENKVLYEKLKSNNEPLPNQEVFDLAFEGFLKLRNTLDSDVLTIIDYSLPSIEKRMWVIDTETAEVINHTVVAHGRNSGGLIPSKFSNRVNSFKTSLGFYKTGETYYGSHGYSLKLDGLEEDINDRARRRAIVIHGSKYAREEYALRAGRLGRSLGCPAVPQEISKELINQIKEGSLIFAYANDHEYLSSSKIINS